MTEWSMTRSTAFERVDLLRVAAELGHGVAHGGEIDHGRHAGEVLHQHARRAEGDLGPGLAVLQPGAEARDVLDRDRAPVLMPEQVLGQDAQRDRQARGARSPAAASAASSAK